MTNSGELVRTLRKRAGFTQQDLANHTGTAMSSVYKWEKGRLPEPKVLIMLIRLARAMDEVQLAKSLEPYLAKQLGTPVRF